METPQPGQATYPFSKPASMPELLAIYTGVTREDLIENRRNVAERFAFLGRLIHSLKSQAWLNELKLRLGESLDYVESSVGRDPQLARKL